MNAVRVLGWSAVALALAMSCSSPNPAATFASSSGGAGPGSGSANGVGGAILSGAAAAASSGSGPSGPIAINDCPGPLSSATVAALKAGGKVDAAMVWLYPYDNTVFPGGLLAPVLQWTPQSGGAQSIYVHLSSKQFDYKGCFPGANPAQLTLPDTVWATATAQSEGATDPLSVELTTLVGKTVSGPIKETWTIALGSLKGSVYYNTYTSPQVMNNGAVMRIKPGAASPEAFLSIPGTSPVGPCISCHSLSANGAILAAQRHQYPGGLLQSESYDLVATPIPNPASPLATSTTDDWGFGALYPDGSRLLTDGAPSMTGGVFPAGLDNNPGMIGPKASVLFNPKTGAVVNAKGLSVQYAKMPMFSPDGKKVVFNFHEASSGHTLAVMDYDVATDTFSNLSTLFTDPALYPGWPFFTPDAKTVVFALGNAENYASLLTLPIGAVSTSDLFLIDLATKTPRSLARANGYNGTTGYLPYPGRDEHLMFYPTVSPVAAGGYFWVYFTSRRNYGNTIVGTADNTASKKIWVAAIDIDAPAGADPSHPPFYLPGQELASGNIRAFATLDPCKANGASCTSGVDCCGGFCTGGKCAPPMGCASTDDKCATSADCCNKTETCIGGYCSFIVK